jgi:hypothetical protein
MYRTTFFHVLSLFDMSAPYPSCRSLDTANAASSTTCLKHYSLAISTHPQPFLEARHGFLTDDDDSSDEDIEKEDDLLAEVDGLFSEDETLFEEGDALFTSDNGFLAEEKEEGSVDGNAGSLDKVGVA